MVVAAADLESEAARQVVWQAFFDERLDDSQSDSGQNGRDSSKLEPFVVAGTGLRGVGRGVSASSVAAFHRNW